MSSNAELKCPKCNSKSFRHRSTKWSPYICIRCGEEFGDTNWGCLILILMPIQLMYFILKWHTLIIPKIILIIPKIILIIPKIILIIPKIIKNPKKSGLIFLLLVTPAVIDSLFGTEIDGEYTTMGGILGGIWLGIIALIGIYLYIARYTNIPSNPKYQKYFEQETKSPNWEEQVDESNKVEELLSLAEIYSSFDSNEQSKKCTECNFENEEDSKFCSECGHKLDDSQSK